MPAALFLIFALLAIFVIIYVRRFQTGLAESVPTIAGICGLALATLLVGVFFSQPPWHLEFLPLTITALMLALAYNSQFALLLSLCLALSLSVILGTGVERFLQALAGLATAVLLLRSVRTRTQLVEVAAIAGAVVPGHDRGHRPADRSDLAADPGRRRPPFPVRGPGRLSADRRAAAGRALLRRRHRHQPAGTGRRLASAAARNWCGGPRAPTRTA